MIHFALIGAGKHGTRWTGVLSRNKNVSLDLIIDPNKEKAKEVISKIEKFCFISAIIENINNLQIDAVVIAVPHKYLASTTEFCLKSGKHVLCEKPGANKSDQIKKNIELSKKKKLIYKIGYNYRFHDGFIKARKLYEKGVIGDILFIRATHGFGGREGYEKEWRINKDIGGGGHLHDQGTHLIDMAKFYLGDVKRVCGFMADTYWKAGTEDNAFVLLQNKKGIIASIHSSLTQWKRKHTFEIYGTKGYLIIEGLGMRYGEPEKLILGKRTKDPDVVKERVIKCDSIADHSLEKELKEFVSAIKKGTPLSPTPLDAYETLRLVEEVYKENKCV
jgi:predicted dehydrogenase